MRLLLATLLLLPFAARATEFIDSAGRHVRVPDHVERVLPAGEPAAVLLATLAPSTMIGWPHPVGAESAAWLPEVLRALPAAPAVDPDHPEAVMAANPDLIIDYGTVNQRYIDRADKIQSRTGIPTLLIDGALLKVPQTLRALGAILRVQVRAEELADVSFAILGSRPMGANATRSVVFARGKDGLDLAPAGVPATEVFSVLHWQVLAPPGEGDRRPTTLAAIGALDPDVIIFADPGMRAVVAGSKEWQALRAVREHRAFTQPTAPFGWISEPPSVNRLAGVAWLSGDYPMASTYVLSALAWQHLVGHTQMEGLAAALKPVGP